MSPRAQMGLQGEGKSRPGGNRGLGWGWGLCPGVSILQPGVDGQIPYLKHKI